MKKILIYGPELSLGPIAKAMRFSYAYLGDTDLGETMQSLMSRENKEAKETKENFWYLIGFDKKEIQTLDRWLQQEKIAVDCMAVHTETNEMWTLETLYAEVKEEREYFIVRQQLLDLLMHPDKEKLKEDPMYLRIMSLAFALTEDQNAKKEDFLQAIDRISNFM